MDEMGRRHSVVRSMRPLRRPRAPQFFSLYFASNSLISERHLPLRLVAVSILSMGLARNGSAYTVDVLAVLQPIWQKKPETASRLRGRIERVLNAAKAKGYRTG
jgi:hypothetical protein